MISSSQVSFGVHKTEQDAARQYDRALIIVKGRLAKTNFPMADYEREVEVYESYVLERCVPRACPQWTNTLCAMHASVNSLGLSGLSRVAGCALRTALKDQLS